MISLLCFTKILLVQKIFIVIWFKSILVFFQVFRGKSKKIKKLYNKLKLQKYCFKI